MLRNGPELRRPRLRPPSRSRLDAVSVLKLGIVPPPLGMRITRPLVKGVGPLTCWPSSEVLPPLLDLLGRGVVAAKPAGEQRSHSQPRPLSWLQLMPN